MPGLLDLPREIRNQILEDVLTSLDPPQNPKSLDNRLPYHDTPLQSIRWARKHVLYPTRQYTPPSWPLLLTNCQLHSETRDALTRVKMNYTLDAAVWKERWVLPTWLNAPALSEAVDTVAVKVRILGVPESPGKSGLLRFENWGPPPLIWCFFAMLERFLMRGILAARGPFEMPFEERRVHIGVLDVDFLTPTEIPKAGIMPETMELTLRNLSIARLRNGELRILHPLPLMEELRFWLKVMISLERSQYGRILYKRIGEIRLRCDGEVKQSWNLREEWEKLEEKFEAMEGRYPWVTRRCALDCMRCNSPYIECRCNLFGRMVPRE